MSKDYCSFSPEGNWPTCCKKHDKDYEDVACGKSRLKVDYELMKCITKKAPNVFLTPAWAIVGLGYFGMVRVFGSKHVQKYCKLERAPVWKE